MISAIGHALSAVAFCCLLTRFAGAEPASSAAPEPTAPEEAVMISRSMGTGFNKRVQALHLRPDGGVFAAGSFSVFDGTPVARGIAKLDRDGILDRAFTKRTRDLFDDAEFLAVLADGQSLWLGGACRLKDQEIQAGLVRLSLSGDLDANVTHRLAKGFSGGVMALALQPNGSLLVGGNFSTLGGQPAGGIARLSPQGALDSGFAAQVGTGISEHASISSIFVQTDGKILLVGDFKTFNEHKVDGIVRLEASGAMDDEFLRNARLGYFVGFQLGNPDDEENEAGLFLSDITADLEGNLFIGGEFVFYDDEHKVANTRLLKLLPDGKMDLSFMKNIKQTKLGGDVNSVLVQKDGRILIGCDKPFARINADGTLDTDFQRLAGFGFRGSVYSMVMESGDKILIGGQFNSYKGIRVGNLVRINPDGTMDERFLASSK